MERESDTNWHDKCVGLYFLIQTGKQAKKGRKVKRVACFKNTACSFVMGPGHCSCISYGHSVTAVVFRNTIKGTPCIVGYFVLEGLLKHYSLRNKVKTKWNNSFYN
jgi:hypothetical protein